jgi:hypothetical protein
MVWFSIGFHLLRCQCCIAVVDLALGFSWQNMAIPGGASVSLSFILGSGGLIQATSYGELPRTPFPTATQSRSPVATVSACPFGETEVTVTLLASGTAWSFEVRGNGVSTTYSTGGCQIYLRSGGNTSTILVGTIVVFQGLRLETSVQVLGCSEKRLS